MLEAESDRAKRVALRGLLANAREAECLILEECRLDNGDKNPWEDAHRWRIRAEEYRARAYVMHDDTAYQACLRLAKNYDALAERAETKARVRDKCSSRTDHD